MKHNNASLQKKAFIGVLWSFLNKFASQLLAFIPAMILARLLNPEDYGIIAMSGIFTGFVWIFVDSGFGAALIQKQNLRAIDITSVFYFNLFVSILVYIILFSIAPFASHFFKMPELVNLMRTSSLGVIIGSLGSIHNILFSKELDFKHPTIRNLSAQILGLSVALPMAYLKFGYWALVSQELVSVSTITILNWSMSSWRPTCSFSFQSLKSLFGYGSKLFFKSVTDYGFGKLYDVTIGKIYSAASLSFYNRAYSTVGLFIDSFLGVMNSAAFPTFSKMQDNVHRMQINIVRFLLIEFMLMSFLMLFCITMAEPLFHFLYSSKWNAVIPLFQLLCIWGLLRPISMIFANGLMAIGRSDICFRNSVIGRSLNVIFLIITWNYGLSVMIIGQMVAFFIEVILYSIGFRNVFSYSFSEMIKNLSPYLLISLVVNIIVYLVDCGFVLILDVMITSEFLLSAVRLLIGCLTGLFVFLTVSRLSKISAFIDFRNIIYDMFKTKAKLLTVAQIVLGC